jgi:hypothetical protein
MTLGTTGIHGSLVRGNLGGVRRGQQFTSEQVSQTQAYMTKSRAKTEEVSMAEAARRLGMTPQSVGMYSKRPDAPVRLKDGRFYCLWPAFPVWYRQELQRGREKPSGLEESRARKLAAEAELAELDLSERRGELLSTSVVRAGMQDIVTRLRGQVLALPSRFAPRTVNLQTLPASQGVWDDAARDVLQGLADGDGD